MSEQRFRSGLFDTLKQVLRAQGIQYRELSEKLDLSEPTIKRLFQDQDCKLSRLMEICDAIGMSFSDLVAMEQNKPAEPSRLPLDTEQALARKPALMSCFMLLLSGFDSDTIASHYKLSDSDIYRYLRDLEKLELISLGTNNRVHFRVNKPIRWRLDGPLHKLLVEVNQTFLGRVIEQHTDEDYQFYSTSRLLSEHSAEQLQQSLDKVYQQFQQLANQDQLFYPEEQLRPWKLVTAVSPFALQEVFKLPDYDQQP